MTTQVLCVMENHSPSSTYYPLESTIFSSGSDIEIDKECESSESTFDISLNSTLKEEENQQLEIQDECEEHIVVKEKPPCKEDEERNKIQSKVYSRCNPVKKYLLVTSCALINVTVGILKGTAQTTIGLLDFLIRFCMNEGVHNVLMVTLTVAVEVFVIMVFAVATILATIIINVDDAYRNRHEVKCKERLKSEYVRSQRAEGSALPVKVKTAKSRRREKVSRRSSRSSKLSVRALECARNFSESEAFIQEDRSSHVVNEDLKCSMESLPLSKGFDNEETKSHEIDINHSLKYQDSIIEEEVNEPENCRSETSICVDTDTEVKNVKSNANESLPLQDSGNHVNNKQSTIYRNKVLTIQDNDNSLRKQNNHCGPKPTQLFMGRDFDDGIENIDQNESLPNESADKDRENKDKKVETDLVTPNSSPVTNYDNLETDSVCTSQLSTSDCDDSRPEIENYNGNTLSSFVSTKRMFENNKDNN